MRPWRTLRIFISSTFRDMHSERDHLVRVVFPELRERCARRRLHVVDVDLRWGVTEEEAERGQVLEVCLDEIERCRPFFVGILGERYGSVLPAASIPDAALYDGLRGLERTHSVTALEIYHGVLRRRGGPVRSFFYFRDPAFIADVPVELRDSVQAESAGAARKLEALKADIRRQCPVFEPYPCTYAGWADGHVVLGGLDIFGRRVLDDLWSAVCEEYPDDAAVPDDLEVERSYHEAFIESRTQRFVGRADLLARLTRYAESEPVSPLVVAGAPGSGKSALLARFVRDFARDHPEAVVISHFIGASPGSADIRRTLSRLCRELGRREGSEARPPEDFHELWQEFLRSLARAGTRGRVLLVIDALDQLEARDDPQALHWLPAALPPGVGVVVSTLAGGFLTALGRRRPAPEEVAVGALGAEDRRALVRDTLWEFRKRLDERAGFDQLGRLLAKAEADNPLFLVVACEELRLFGEFERVSARIDGLPDDVEHLLAQVLERLERDHGEDLVRRAFSLLACSRHGLLESEVLDLLRPDGAGLLPRAVWARLYRGVKAYLRPPGEADEGVLDFFHRQFAQAVRTRYLTSDAERAAHAALADMFRRRVQPDGDGRWRRDYPRGLSELPHHLLLAGRYGEVMSLARDEAFLDAVASEFPDDPQQSVEALEKALDAAARLDDAARMAEFVLAAALRRARVSEQSPFDALRRGQLARAWELADLHPPERSALWHLLLAWEMTESGAHDQARATLRRLAQRELPRLPGGYWAAKCGLQLLARVAGVDEAAFETLEQGLLEDEDRADLCYAAAAAGHAAAAQAAAARTHDKYRRADAHRYVAEAQAEIVTRLAEAGDIESAVAGTGAIAGERARSRAYRAVAAAQARAGSAAVARASFEAAVALAHDAPEELAAIAAAQRAAGFASDASTTLKAAAERAREHVGGYDRTVTTVVSALMDGGEPELAAGLAGAIESRIHRGEALLAIATAWARAGNDELALETVSTMTRPEDETASLVAIAREQAARGHVGAARDTFAAAQRMAMTAHDILDGGSPLRDVGLAQVQAGFAEDGQETFRLAFEAIRRDSQGRPDLNQLKNLAVRLARAGALDAALETADAMTAGVLPESSQVDALAGVAAAAAATGHADRARGILERLLARVTATLAPAVDSFGAIARAYLAMGDFASACAVVKAGKDRGWTAAEYVVSGVFGESRSDSAGDRHPVADSGRARAIVADLLQAHLLSATADRVGASIAIRDLVSAVLDTGRIDSAMVLADSVPDDFYRDDAHERVAGALARAGRLDEAMACLGTIAADDRRAAARGTVAAGLARAGDVGAAQMLIEALDERERSRAGRRLAYACVERGDFERAWQLAGADGMADARFHLTCAEAQAAACDWDGARASLARAIESARQGAWGDEVWDHEGLGATLCTVAELQRTWGMRDESRATLDVARDVGLRCMAAAHSRTDRERDVGAGAMMRVGEHQAKGGWLDDAMETIDLMRTRQMVWHREVQKTKEGCVLKAVSAAHADAARFAEAHDRAVEIEPQDVRIEALQYLASAEHRAGLPEAARRHLAEAAAVAVEEIDQA